VGAVLIGRYLHRAPYLGKIILAGPREGEPTAVAVAVSPAPAPEQERKRTSELVGRRGRALSMLRPAVEITAVHGNRIIVRRAR